MCVNKKKHICVNVGDNQRTVEKLISFENESIAISIMNTTTHSNVGEDAKNNINKYIHYIHCLCMKMAHMPIISIQFKFLTDKILFYSLNN